MWCLEEREDPARDPEGSLVTLDNMKTDRGEWTPHLQIHSEHRGCRGGRGSLQPEWTPERTIKTGHYVTADQPCHWLCEGKTKQNNSDLCEDMCKQHIFSDLMSDVVTDNINII